MIKAMDFKWLDRVYHLFYLGSYLCLSGTLTDCFLSLYLKHHWVGGRAAKGFGQDRIRTLVSMATDIPIGL